MASKYPVKSGYKYSFYRTRLGEPLHQPAYEFDLTDPNCYLLKTEYNNLHDPHLKSFFYNKIRRGQLLSRGLISKDSMVKCSLQEFNQYSNYIHHRMTALNKQYMKEQEHIRKQIDNINRSNAKLLEKIHKREQYKTQLLKKMEKNWQKNDLRLLSQMRKERSHKPVQEKRKPVLGICGDSGDASSLSSYTVFTSNIHKEKTSSILESLETKATSSPVTSPSDLLTKYDPSLSHLQPATQKFGAQALTSPTPETGFNTDVHTEEKVSELDPSKGNTFSLTTSTSIETIVKWDLPACDLEHFKDTYSTMFQKIFSGQSDYLSSISEDLVEVVFDKICSAAPGHHIEFTPIKTTAKETWHDVRGKSACRYLISRLEVMSVASEIVDNVLSKWHEIAVQKCSIQYDAIFEERTSFRKLFKFFICARNQEEMYKAALPIATESIQESNEEIVKIVLAHLEKFANSRSRAPSKHQSDSAVVFSLTDKSLKSDDNSLVTRSLTDVLRPYEPSQNFLKKELENLAKSIDQPEQMSIKLLITTILKIIGVKIDNDRRLETGKKITISAEEKFMMYKYLEKNYNPFKKERLRNYSTILRLPKSHEGDVDEESFTVPDSGEQFLRAVIEEVNVPGMVSHLEDEDRLDNIKADGIKLDHYWQYRGHYQSVNFTSHPLVNQDNLDHNCFLLNMFNFDHLAYSQNEFNRPLNVIVDLVSKTLIKILNDLQYPIPEHLYGLLDFPNSKYDVDTTIKYQKDSNALLLPSDISSFSHHLVEYILKKLYATSSYDKWKESLLSIFSQVESIQNTYVLTDCNKVASPSKLCHSQVHNIWEEIAQTVSAKMQSFLLLKFKTYLSTEEIPDTNLIQSIPGMHKELEVHTKGIVTRLLGKIAESVSEEEDDTSLTCALIHSLLDHISNKQCHIGAEEWQPKLSTSHDCLDSGCVLHNISARPLQTCSPKSRLQDIASSILGETFKQIMETIEAKSLQSVSAQSTALGFDTDLSKCCQDSFKFLQMEINALSKSIVEDLINTLCSAKQRMKRDKSLFQHQGSVVTEFFLETISQSVLGELFVKFRGFMSLAVKLIHPLSRNISEEIYFPRMFVQQDLFYCSIEDPKRKLRSSQPKSNVYEHSKHLSHEIVHVIQNQLDKISNNIRHSLRESEAVAESNNPLVFEVQQLSLHSSFSQDEDAHIMQYIETNIRRNILQKLGAHLKVEDLVRPEIGHEVKKVILMVFKQLLIDLSVPLKGPHSSQMNKIHQKLLSETLLTSNQNVDSSPFSDSEVDNLSRDILKILSDIIHTSNESEFHDPTVDPNRNILDHIYGGKATNTIFTRVKKFVVSKILSLFCQLIKEPSQSETKKGNTRLESYAQELADKILCQAEEHLREQIKDTFPSDNFLPLSNTDVGDRIVSVLTQSLKHAYQEQEGLNMLSSSVKEENQEKAIKCNAMEIAKMVETVIGDTIDNLRNVNLSNITLDICAKILSDSVLALIQRELEEEKRFVHGDKKYILDNNTLASEIVNIILETFDVKGASRETSLTNVSYNTNGIHTHETKCKMSRLSHRASCSESEVSALIHEVECVLYEVQTNIVLELKSDRFQLSLYNNQPNESSSEYFCETCLGFTSSDVKFVAKNIVELIIAKLSRYLQDVLSYPNLSSEEHCCMLLQPKDMPCFSETRNNSHVHIRCDRTNSMDGSFVDYSLGHQLVAAVSDKTAAFAATIALKYKPHLPVHVQNEDIGTFLAHVNITSSRLESYAKDIVMKVLENIEPGFSCKLLDLRNKTQHEVIQAMHLIGNILRELSLNYDTSLNVSEEVTSYNRCTESDAEYGESVDYPKASTPGLSSYSDVNDQRWLRVTGVVSLTNSNTESDFENGEVENHPEDYTPRLPLLSSLNEQRWLSVTEGLLTTSSSVESDFESAAAMGHPRASTPKPSSSSPSVSEQIRFRVPEVLSPTYSNTEADAEIGESETLQQSFTKRPSSPPSVNEQRRYSIRLHFL
ncbi:fibrous sheath-interacting protein 2 [Leptodactylus fuscus]